MNSINSQPRFSTATDDTAAARAVPRSQRTPLPTGGGDFSLLSPLAFSMALSTPHVENANYGYPTTLHHTRQQLWMEKPSNPPQTRAVSTCIDPLQQFCNGDTPAFGLMMHSNIISHPKNCRVKLTRQWLQFGIYSLKNSILCHG